MKKILGYFILLSLLSFCSCSEKTDSPAYSNQPATIGTEKDPFARANYERMQLVDPKTGEIPKNIRQKEQMFAKTLSDQKNNSIIDEIEWKNRGPFFVGGRTRAFVFDHTNENLILAGSVSGGIWKSEDAGNSWRKTNTFGNNISVTAIAQDPRPGHENEWYYGTGESFGASQGLNASYNGSGIYKSEDYGENWSIVSSFDPGTPTTFNDQREAIYDIKIDPTKEDLHIYVTAIGAVYRSIDNLESWQPTLITPLGSGGLAYFVDLEISSTGVFYASFSNENEIIGTGVNSKGGVWRSVDGEEWVRIQDSTFPPRYNRIDMAINPSDENEIYMIIGDVTPEFGKFTKFGTFGESYNAIYKYNYLSGDGSGEGGIWTTLTDNVPNGSGFIDGYHSQSGYDMAIAIHPTEPNTVFIAGTNLYRSTDGFSTSDNITYLGGYEENSIRGSIKATDDFHPDIHGIKFLPSNPETMYVYSDGGVYKTDSSTGAEMNWQSLNNGYITTQYYTLFIDPSEETDRLIAGAQDDALRMNDSEAETAPWAKTLFGDGSYGAFTDTFDEIIGSSQQGNIFKIKIDENNDQIARERMTPLLERSDFLFIHPFALDPNDDNILYLPVQNKLMVNTRVNEFEFNNSLDSTAFGWHVMQDSLTQSGLIFTSIDAPKEPAGRVYLGTNSKRIYRVENATDPNSTLIDITPNIAPNGGFLRSITTDVKDSDRVIALFSNYNVYSLYISEDAGTTWDRIAGNLEQFSTGVGNGPSFKWSAIQHIDDELTVYWVGTSVGLFYTDELDGIRTEWTLAAPDLIGNNIISMIRTKTKDNLIVVATHGNGIFSANPTAGVASATNDESVSINLKLYPNPTSDLLQVDLSNNATKFEGYKIFDVSGRELIKESINLNTTLSIDVADYNPGIYYLSLITKENKEVVRDFVKQ